jgi:chromosomal replication initiator protein
MELTAQDIWSRLLEAARPLLPEHTFRTWLAPTEAVAVTEDQLVVATPNAFAIEWIERHYAPLLIQLGERLFGRRFVLCLQHNGRGAPPPPPAAAVRLPIAAPLPPVAVTAGREAPESTPLNPRYTFDRFVIGSNNQLAAAAAHAVAEAPGRLYNPLFIYGGVGLGKTHLMQAIGHEVRRRDPRRRVVYVSCERFTNELIGAIQAGSMAEFRRRYRSVDVLLVDDIQFLEGKRQTQEEFFHTFNAIYDAQGQIVLTSDRPPKEIGVEDRLVSRFEWGLVADIQPPDYETRLAILRLKIEEIGLDVPPDSPVLDYIARYCTSSVRDLEGKVRKLQALSVLERREITLDLARLVLEPELRLRPPETRARVLTPEGIRRRVAQAWGVSEEALQSKRRTKDVTLPRQVAMYLIKELLGLPLVEIGRLFGGRDHSTVIHALGKVEEEIRLDPALRDRIEALRAELSGVNAEAAVA